MIRPPFKEYKIIDYELNLSDPHRELGSCTVCNKTALFIVKQRYMYRGDIWIGHRYVCSEECYMAYKLVG